MATKAQRTNAGYDKVWDAVAQNPPTFADGSVFGEPYHNNGVGHGNPDPGVEDKMGASYGIKATMSGGEGPVAPKPRKTLPPVTRRS